MLEGSGLRVLVVGGGSVAARKAGALCVAGAVVRLVAPEVGAAIRALVETGRVEYVARRYAAGDVGDADLVIAATDDRATNSAVAAEARAAHRLVNVADAPDEGTFVTMAAHHAGGLVIGVSAGVPAAAARIRDAIAERFDARYGVALAELSGLRDVLLAAGRGARWREVSADVTGAGFCDTIDAGRFEERMRPWR
jgi:precorrin-2 dehydrogenase/sirohydrochlorin ferrochelatase